MTPDPLLRVVFDRDRGTLDIRQSAISSFMDCRRKFFYEYVLGLEPDYPDRARPWSTADTGTGFHVGIGAYYLGNDPLDAVDIWMSEQWPDGDPEKSQRDLVTIMVEGHVGDLQDQSADVGETTIGVEVPVTATVTGVNGVDVTIHGQVDRLIENDEGLLILDDWKSVTTFAEIDNYLHQLGRYALMVRSSQGWRADRVRTTQVKRVKRTKGGPFFQRPWSPLSEAAYETHSAGLRAVLSDIVNVVSADGPWYERYSTECGWKCRSQSICQALLRGDDPELIIELDYRKKQA